MRLVILILILAAPAQAGWQMQSTDTGTGSAVVWDDHASYRTTHPGDAGAFELWLATDSDGEYQWSLPRTVDGRQNPLHGAFASLRIRTDGYEAGDLAVENATSARIHLAAGEPRTFAVQYRLRPFTDLEVQELLQKTLALYEDPTQARAGEVFGWISLLQADTPPCPPQRACIAMRQGFHFGISLRLDARLPVLELTSTKVHLIGTDAATGALLYQGTCYTSNTDSLVRIHVTGRLATAPIEFFLDDWRTPLAGTGSAAAWIPGTETATARLPAGRHCILYKVNGTETTGTIHFDDSRQRFAFQDDFAQHGTLAWLWLLLLTLVLTATVLLLWFKRRKARGRDEGD